MAVAVFNTYLQTKYRAEIEGLEKQVQERQNIIDEKEEDIYALNERLRDQVSP